MTASRAPQVSGATGELAPADADPIVRSLLPLLADVFALYMKTKGFHWHVAGPNFRDLHLLFDEQAGQILGMTDALAERARKLGGLTIRSIGEIARHQRIADNHGAPPAAEVMVAELHADNGALLASMREVHKVCDTRGDVATTSLLENWIDETERRIWFLRQVLAPTTH